MQDITHIKVPFYDFILSVPMSCLQTEVHNNKTIYVVGAYRIHEMALGGFISFCIFQVVLGECVNSGMDYWNSGIMD